MNSPEGLNNESFEKLKWHYIYYNNEIAGHPVVFECDADNISQADEKFEETIGKKPEKQNHIGCSILKN